MSLARIALRIAVAEALRGRTLVGDNVLDSQIGALDADANGNILINQERPFVAVYTDSAKVEGSDAAPRALLQNGQCDLVIETGITTAMTEVDPDTGESTVVGLPGTDANFELMLDLVARQIVDALLDGENPWSMVYQGLCERVLQIQRARIGHDRGGVRLAAQEIRLTLLLVEDPVDLDENGDSAFGKFLELLAASEAPHLLKIGETLAEQLSSDLPDWEMQRRRLGLSIVEAEVLGSYPVRDEEGQPIEVAQITVATDGLMPETVVTDD